MEDGKTTQLQSSYLTPTSPLSLHRSFIHLLVVLNGPGLMPNKVQHNLNNSDNETTMHTDTDPYQGGRLGLLEKLDVRPPSRILRQPSKLEPVPEKSNNVRSENPQPMDSQYG
ncbi:hypothetical protein PIB30_106833 [Stylosanthes scabra]|uniref:Uncharacterized protein n=1 Tax=Stylosanthes scabra TaxID=79078 RepID=A0ABU6RYT3_9FABA|nr:hypothetical protein [Stylosanthes scabra]